MPQCCLQDTARVDAVRSWMCKQLARTAVSSTVSALAGLWHRGWKGALARSWVCAALQLFIRLFLMVAQDIQSTLI